MVKIETLLILSATLFLIPATAFCDITGLWTGTTVVSGGGGTFANTVTYIQSGTTITGSTPPSQNGICSYSGTLIGSQLTLSASCPSVNYSSNSTATVNAENNFIQGTFSDSQGTTGTFTQSKQQNTLVPGKELTEAPLAVVQDKNVTITVLKFNNAGTKSTAQKSLFQISAAKGLKVKYEVSIKGAEKRKLTSKKNIITVKNLKPGNYTVSYKAVAFNGDQKSFSSKPSPSAGFTIN